MDLTDTQSIIDFANSLLGDTLDNNLALQLAENAKNIIEGSRNWRMLIKEDATKTFGSGETYLTSKDLPIDFFMDDRVYLGVQADEDYSEYTPIPFHQRRIFYQNGFYTIDYANKKIYICDKVSKTYTIYLYYIYETPVLTVSTGPVWPKKYWQLISFLMVSLQKKGVDFDDINIQQALAHDQQASLLWNDMILWDSQISLKAIGGKGGFRGYNGGTGDRKINMYS